jgi:hypothetical protein
MKGQWGKWRFSTNSLRAGSKARLQENAPFRHLYPLSCVTTFQYISRMVGAHPPWARCSGKGGEMGCFP